MTDSIKTYPLFSELHKMTITERNQQLFTDVEWDAISSAMEDYSDYGDCEANIADSIQAKIATIFRLTSD